MKEKNGVRKVLAAIIALICLLLCSGCGILDGMSPQNQAEKNAIKFMEYQYEGNAQKFIDLMLDELVEEFISSGGYKTEEVLVYAWEKELYNDIENYKDEYGKKWKYTISVIDSYEIESLEDFPDCKCMEVVLKIEHEGKKLIFFPKNGSEEIKIQLINKDDVWYVFGTSNINL